MSDAALPLFDFVLARKRDPDTSHKAARSADSMNRDRAEVLRVHRAHPAGLSDFELAALMGRQQTSVGKRRGELRDMGLIVDSKERRPSPSGSSAIVWKIRGSE